MEKCEEKCQPGDTVCIEHEGECNLLSSEYRSICDAVSDCTRENPEEMDDETLETFIVATRRRYIDFNLCYNARRKYEGKCWLHNCQNRDHQSHAEQLQERMSVCKGALDRAQREQMKRREKSIKE